MSLADVAKQGPVRVEKGPTCSVCLLATTLPKAEAAALAQMLGDPEWRYTSIADALNAEGHSIYDGAVSRHVRGQCGARTKLR